MAELEEEEHSLDRLRRWHRDITARDVFGAPPPPRPANGSSTATSGWPSTPSRSLRPCTSCDPTKHGKPSMDSDTRFFYDINDFARAYPVAARPTRVRVCQLWAGVFAGLLLAGWWIARRTAIPTGWPRRCGRRWACLPPWRSISQSPLLVNETRPYQGLHDIVVLATATTDPGFPSDHAVMAGAVTAGVVPGVPPTGPAGRSGCCR